MVLLYLDGRKFDPFFAGFVRGSSSGCMILARPPFAFQSFDLIEARYSEFEEETGSRLFAYRMYLEL